MKDMQSTTIINTIDGEEQAPRQRLRNRYFISRHTVIIHNDKKNTADINEIQKTIYVCANKYKKYKK